MTATTAAAQLLEGLNPTQRDVVVAQDEALLVIAGAGTGKTRVLTHRIAHLIAAEQVHPASILAATFTNKAASEMIERISHLTAGRARYLTLGTFHRICTRFLRDFAGCHPYGATFAIYDTDEQLAIVKQAMKALDIDPKVWQPRSILGRISQIKSRGLTLEAWQQDISDRTIDWLDEVVAKIFPRYQQTLRHNRAFDFDDLILEGTRLLRDVQQVHDRLRSQFRYVFVDEFQDINQAQWDLIKALAGTPQETPHAHLFAVGDDDQSIYGFRGAHAGFLDDFQQTYHPRVILLEDNYRSTDAILRVANRIIAKKDWGPVKTLRAMAGEGPRPTAWYTSSDVEEAMTIAEQIETLIRSTAWRYRDCAVLYRQNAQSRTLEEVFARLGLPHQVIGGQRFYARQEIRDVVSWMRLLNNDRDLAALQRAVQSPPRGIGQKTLEQLTHLLEERQIGLLALTEDPLLLHEFPNRARLAIGGLVELLSRLNAVAARGDLKVLLDAVLEETGYTLALQQSKAIEDLARLDNIDELKGAIADWAESYPDQGLNEWLAEQALVADVDKYDPEADAVTLMTLHAAKGLEFPVVFLPGLEEGILPHFRSLDEGSDAEELRLAYVGCTRAKEQLFLSAAQVRRFQGNLQQQAPSRFLRSLTPDDLAGQELHLLLLTSELGGSGWSQESGSGVGWRRHMAAEQYTDDSYGGRRPSWGNRAVEREPWEIAEDLPGDPPRERRTPRSLSLDRPFSGTRAAAQESAPADPSHYTIGEQVEHSTFGVGEIISITPAGSDYFLSIQFPGVGLKMLSESKAPLTKVS